MGAGLGPTDETVLPIGAVLLTLDVLVEAVFATIGLLGEAGAAGALNGDGVGAITSDSFTLLTF